MGLGSGQSPQLYAGGVYAMHTIGSGQSPQLCLPDGVAGVRVLSSTSHGGHDAADHCVGLGTGESCMTRGPWAGAPLCGPGGRGRVGESDLVESVV